MQTAPSTQSLITEQEKTEVQTLKLSEEETKYRGFLLRRLMSARDMREQPHRDFDGLTYSDDYQANHDAAISYLTPKKNDDDVRINTATTEKKVEAVMNELLSMNIQHEVHAYDQYDKKLRSLGEDFEHIVTKTNTIEKEDDMWADMIRELLTQRAVFVKEKLVERTVYDKQSKTKKYTIKRCEKVVVPGKKVFLGSLNIPAYKFNEQPYYFEYDRTDYQTAKTMFQSKYPEKWAQVKPGGTLSTSITDEESFFNFRVSDCTNEEVEILYYYDYPNDEYQIIVNSVPMLPPGTPLPHEFEGYNMVMVSLKTIRANFPYGKPLVATAKTLQGLENETIRNLIRKFRQALEPPTGTISNQVFSRRIWAPGAMTQGITKNTFSKLIEHDGVTDSEMKMFDLITSKTEEFIGVSRTFQGLPTGGEKTATQALEELKQSVKMLGLAVWAVLRVRRDCTYLRIYNLIENFTDPISAELDHETGEVINKFNQFTIEGVTLSSGDKGTKVVAFSDKDLTPQDEEEIYQMEEDMAVRENRNVRIHVVNVKKLRAIPIFWYVTAQEKERAGSALEKIMFREQMAQAAAIEVQSQGQVRVNWRSAADKAEIIWRSKDLFEKMPPNMQQPQMQNGEEEKPNVGKDILSQLSAFEQNTGIGAQLMEGQSAGAKQVPMKEMVQ